MTIGHMTSKKRRKTTSEVDMDNKLVEEELQRNHKVYLNGNQEYFKNPKSSWKSKGSSVTLAEKEQMMIRRKKRKG